MERNEASDTRDGTTEKGPFERFVETVYGRVSRAPFFFICLGIVFVWMLSLPLWHDLKSWQASIHTVSSVLSLLLLVLLENASRRTDEAAQEKLNVLAEGLAALMESGSRQDPSLVDAEKKLRRAVGLEERH